MDDAMGYPCFFGNLRNWNSGILLLLTGLFTRNRPTTSSALAAFSELPNVMSFAPQPHPKRQASLPKGREKKGQAMVPPFPELRKSKVRNKRSLSEPLQAAATATFEGRPTHPSPLSSPIARNGRLDVAKCFKQRKQLVHFRPLGSMLTLLLCRNFSVKLWSHGVE